MNQFFQGMKHNQNQQENTHGNYNGWNNNNRKKQKKKDEEKKLNMEKNLSWQFYLVERSAIEEGTKLPPSCSLYSTQLHIVPLKKGWSCRPLLVARIPLSYELLYMFANFTNACCAHT